MVRMSLVIPEVAYFTIRCHDPFFCCSAAAESPSAELVGVTETNAPSDVAGVWSWSSSFSPPPASHAVCAEGVSIRQGDGYSERGVETAKRWSGVATVAKTKELKSVMGHQRVITSVLERTVSRERLFLSARYCTGFKASWHLRSR